MTTKEQAIKNLIDCKKIFAELEIPFCLWGGTMLGAFRDGDFIPHDEDDLDIRMDEKYAEYEKEILSKFEEVGFRKKRNYYFRDKWIGGSVMRGKNHIDIGFFFWKGDNVYTLRRAKRDKRGYEPSVYPKHFFEKFNTIKLVGIDVRVPQDTAKFLEIRYGKDWSIPHLRPKWKASMVKSTKPEYEF